MIFPFPLYSTSLIADFDDTFTIATTNTPALGAAQQTLKQIGLDSNIPALGCAVAYPLGVVGVIFAILLIRKTLVREELLNNVEKDDFKKVYVAAFQVHNPAVFEKSVKEIVRMSDLKFIISRLWRDGHVSILLFREAQAILLLSISKERHNQNA